MTLGNIEIVLQSVSARSERLASLKVFAIMAVCALGVGSAHAQSLRIAGAAGYASEWELSGVVTQVGSTKEFSGPLTFTHVGLCTVDGPLIKSGQIKFEVSGSKQLFFTKVLGAHTTENYPARRRTDLCGVLKKTKSQLLS
jgi:hypothetical protein